MDKQHILNEIRRTAVENNGMPLGRERFQVVTGIKYGDWYGKYWRSWGEAVTEAGYTPNQLQKRFNEEFVVGKLVELIRELGRFPVAADLRMKARSDPAFPSHNVFERIGRKVERVQKAIDYCRDRESYDDVLEICNSIQCNCTGAVTHGENDGDTFGFVYLVKSGRFYKVGRTNSAGRREYELSIQLPERASLVHQIKTDDPAGIEDYWHKRFREKRQNGEWFKLSASDVAAFRRRRFM